MHRDLPCYRQIAVSLGFSVFPYPCLSHLVSTQQHVAIKNVQLEASQLNLSNQFVMSWKYQPYFMYGLCSDCKSERQFGQKV